MKWYEQDEFYELWIPGIPGRLGAKFLVFKSESGMFGCICPLDGFDAARYFNTLDEAKGHAESIMREYVATLNRFVS